MQHLPMFYRVRGQRTLIVGGGHAALAKVQLLMRTGAAITVVAAATVDEMEGLAREGSITLRQKPFAEGDVDGSAVVIAATGNRAVDACVADAARRRGIPVNVVDTPDLSTFLMPAIVDRDPITVAISTAGAAPVLARSVRASIEALLPSRLGDLARFADSFRRAVRANYPRSRARRTFWERFFAGPIAAAVLAGDERWARERMLAEVNRPAADRQRDGIVHLVGSGPGDPDLLTLKALRLLQEADVIVYDRLVGAAILDRGRRDAERIYVGKVRGSRARSQDEINALLLELARAGRSVVRLKGGDPFIFGRGGEEQEFLLRHGIRVEIVPGITAATGCAAATGIPLTHRDHAAAVTLVTGQRRDGAPDVDWAGLVRVRQTLVIYMGQARGEEIAAKLIEAGLDPATPAAVVANGTCPDQRTAMGPVSDLAGTIARAGAGAQLIVIGDVVGHAAVADEVPAPRAVSL